MSEPTTTTGAASTGSAETSRPAAAPQRTAASKGTTAGGQPTTVAAMIDALSTGGMSTADAALWCAMHDWPPAPGGTAGKAAPAATMAQVEEHGQDVRLSQPGTFMEVSTARDTGRITPGQYTALLYAVAGDRSARDAADRAEPAATGKTAPKKPAADT